MYCVEGDGWNLNCAEGKVTNINWIVNGFCRERERGLECKLSWECVV